MHHHNTVFRGVLKPLPWAVVDRSVAEHEADLDERTLKAKPHLIALLLAQLFGLRSLRDIETSLRSHTSNLYHLGGKPISRSALSTANASTARVEVFAAVLKALMAQVQRGYRRKIGDCVRLIDSTSVRLSSLSEDWATFSAGVCGAKAHIIYDPDADQPLYLMVTASNVNDITAAKAMPIEPGRLTSSISAITTMPGGRSSTMPNAASSRGSRPSRTSHYARRPACHSTGR